ncbi:pentatricopeptide repeat-containing protein [Dorcoceras hygrometricum]|uniref:Pentatricopeptide repeat-containing protein n=1 Tax=Dorcoceras hygrometricum TaxID=472368 RepID=A0A2Z7CXQ6_9LAMI|nr:pentatricopeptide repeat-containing protein [Dorcoceras hygrometricum]
MTRPSTNRPGPTEPTGPSEPIGRCKPYPRRHTHTHAMPPMTSRWFLPSTAQLRPPMAGDPLAGPTPSPAGLTVSATARTMSHMVQPKQETSDVRRPSRGCPTSHGSTNIEPQSLPLWTTSSPS